MKDKIFKTIIMIPNSPFLIILSFYVVCKIYKHTDRNEFRTSTTKQFYDQVNESEELMGFAEKAFPTHVRYFIATIFYFWLLWYLVFN